MQKFEDLFESPYIVFDGGVATELYERGFYINRPFEELNTTHPRDVAGVHESYIDAGSMMVTTNSFSLTPAQLEKFDIKNRQGELMHAAINVARQAVENKKSNARVGLTFGPLGVLIEPLGPTSKAEVQNEYENMARLALVFTSLYRSGTRLDCRTTTYISNLFECRRLRFSASSSRLPSSSVRF